MLGRQLEDLLLSNRSDRPAVYLEVSNRDAEDTVCYPDTGVDCRMPR